jgi:hypothetical protein
MRFFGYVLLDTLLITSASEAAPQSLPPGHAPNPKLASAYGTESSLQVTLIAQKTPSIATDNDSPQGSSLSPPAPHGPHDHQQEHGKQ